MDSNSVSRRKFIGVAGGVAAGAAIAGPASAATKKPAAKKPAAKKPAAKTPAAVNNPGTGVVNYWNHFTSPVERAGFEAVTAAFKKDFPAIDLKVEAIQNPDWMTKYITAVQAKSGPDALMVTANRVSDMSRIGGLTDLTVRAKSWDPFFKINGKDAINGLSYIGKNMAVPCFTFIDWMYYRKDYLTAAGIKSAPKTLEEFRLAAIEMTNPDKKRYGFGLRGGAGGGGYISSLMHAMNGPLIDKNGKSILELDAAVDALRFWVHLGTKDKCIPPTAATDGYAQFQGTFQKGDTGMIFHHTGSFVEVGKALKYGIEVETSAMPTGPKSGVGAISPLGNGIFKGSSNPDAAWTFATYWGDTKAQVEFLKATGYYGTSKEAAKDDFVVKNPQYKVALAGLDNYWTAYTFPGVENWQINTCLVEFQKALTGKQTPEQAARAIWTELRDITGTK